MPETDLGLVVGMVLLIRVGQMLLLGGSVRSKNVAGLAARALLDLAVILLAVWAVGGLFLPGGFLVDERPWLSWGQLLGNNGGLRVLTLVVPPLLILTGATLGSTAERTRSTPLLVFAAVTAGLLTPLLFRVGFWAAGLRPHVEFGQSIATLGGGTAALVLARAAGPRKGKYNRDQSTNFVPGHAVVFQIVGLLVMAAGWGMTSPNALHTVLGLSAALVAGAAYGRVRFGKPDVGLLVTAGVGGLAAATLVATTPGGESLSLLGQGGAASVLAGAIAGVVAPWLLIRIETGPRIDDVAGLGAAYVGGGIVGVAVAALARHAETAGVYVGALVFDVAFAIAAAVVIGGAAWGIVVVFTRRGAMRVNEAVEYDGLDLSELDVNAYPDFQQTMIKSHHLRQL